MIRNPTVFVIGAGASAEYGIAVGDDLRGKIGALLDFYIDGREVRSGDSQIIELLRRENARDGHGYCLTNEQFAGAKMVSRAMPHAISIDNFLQAHSKNKEVVRSGKLGIVKGILKEEANSTLSKLRHDRDQFDFEPVSKKWISKVFQILSEGVNKEDASSVFDNVTFIVFNYDRTLEAYLPRALAEYYDLPMSVARQIAGSARIIHPYGSPAEMNKAGELSTPFGSTECDLLAAAENIRTFGEGIVNQELQTNVRYALKFCHTLVFLGFSFHPMNLKILSPAYSEIKRMYATTYGMSESAIHSVRQDLLDIFQRDDPYRTGFATDRDTLDDIAFANLTASDFLTQYFRTLSSF